MRRIGIVGVLLGAMLLGGVGLVAYQVGVSTGTTSAAVAAGATVVYAAPWGLGFGPSLLGLLFGLLFLGLMVGLVRRAAFADRGGPAGPGRPRGPWMMPGGWGPEPSGWAGAADRPVPPPVAEMLGRWHAQAHETAARGAGAHPAASGAGADPAAAAPKDHATATDPG